MLRLAILAGSAVAVPMIAATGTLAGAFAIETYDGVRREIAHYNSVKDCGEKKQIWEKVICIIVERYPKYIILIPAKVGAASYALYNYAGTLYHTSVDVFKTANVIWGMIRIKMIDKSKLDEIIDKLKSAAICLIKLAKQHECDVQSLERYFDEFNSKTLVNFLWELGMWMVEIFQSIIFALREQLSIEVLIFYAEVQGVFRGVLKAWKQFLDQNPQKLALMQ